MSSNYTLVNGRPPLSSGGFLCEEMGLGKTVEMLALVLANPCVNIYIYIYIHIYIYLYIYRYIYREREIQIERKIGR